MWKLRGPVGLPLKNCGTHERPRRAVEGVKEEVWILWCWRFY